MIFSKYQLRGCLATVSLFLSILPLKLLAETEIYDLVILNGRVIDPETKLDKKLNIGVRKGEITAITKESISARQTIDATNKVVVPGFIDVHSHTPTQLGQHLGLLDGITTQLDLEAGSFPIDQYGEHYAGGSQMHYGSSVAHFSVRMKVMDKVDQPYLFTGMKPMGPAGSAWVKPANAEQIEQMRSLLSQGLEQGGLGIGVLLDYMTSAVSEDELRMLFELAAEREVPIYIHVRRGYTGDPAGLTEVIDLAKKTKAAAFICHITHLAMGRVADWLTMIDDANSQGANITTETLSYLAGGTSISADVFKNRDWQAIFDITYEDVQWVATGEWLTKETWEKYAKEQPKGSVNHHYVKEAWLKTALKWPGMMISTDALPTIDRDILSNPNVAGTFSHFLQRYVRELDLMPLSEAIALTSYNQAKWMEQASPAFAKKGRIQLGADADLVIFDPDTITSNAKYGDPYNPPTGLTDVVVAGRHVVKGSQRLEGRYPGKKLLGKHKQ